MKVSYISDLHMDFWVPFVSNQLKLRKRTEDFIEELIKTDEGERDVILLGGDFSHFNTQSLWMLNIFSKHYNQVMFCLGNHDFYLISKNQSEKYGNSSYNRATELIEESTKLASNIIPLIDDTLFTYKGVNFGGSTMWYPLETYDQQVFYHNISNDSKLTKGINIQKEHEKSIVNYKSMIDKDMDVMLSHVPLCHMRSHEMYGSTHCYFTPVDMLPNYVVMGHSHERAIYKKADSLLHINCGGYPRDGLGDMRIESFIIEGDDAE